MSTHSTNRVLRALLLVTASSAPAAAARQAIDEADSVRIHAAALDAIRREFPDGRIVLDRVIADTGTRLALPVISKREHADPDAWTVGLGIETANTEYVQSICADIVLDCRLPENIAVVVGMSQAVVHGDTATLIVRFSENTGTRGHGVRTTVEEMTIVRDGRAWRVAVRRTRAVS